MKGLIRLFKILPIVVIGIYVSYRYVQWLVEDISLTIGIMLVSTVIGAKLVPISQRERGRSDYTTPF